MAAPEVVEGHPRRRALRRHAAYHAGCTAGVWFLFLSPPARSSRRARPHAPCTPPPPPSHFTLHIRLRRVTPYRQAAPVAEGHGAAARSQASSRLPRVPALHAVFFVSRRFSRMPRTPTDGCGAATQRCGCCSVSDPPAEGLQVSTLASSRSHAHRREWLRLQLAARSPARSVYTTTLHPHT